MYRRFTYWLAFAALLVHCFHSSSAHADGIEQQRQHYRAAHKALAAGDTPTFERLKHRLRDYALYPYLVYAQLERTLASAADTEIQRFIRDYGELPLADRLRGEWLHHLMRQGRWKTFLEVYDKRRDTSLKCYALRARIRAGELQEVREDTQRLWLSGSSRPQACDRLFQWFENRGYLSGTLVYARVELALAQGNPRLARYLSKKLDQRGRVWVQRWLRVHQDPAEALGEPALRPDTKLNRKIVRHGIRQLAKRDLDGAKSRWEALEKRYRFSATERAEIERYIALNAAYSHHPQAARWLRALPEQATDEAVRRWRAQTALRRGAWGDLIAAIGALENPQGERSKWRYWRARALEQTGEPARANAIYEQLAEERDYYGFLAADRLGVPYAMAHEALLDQPIAADTLARDPGLVRARELFLLDDFANARAEWRHATQRYSLEQLKLAATLAHRWGWHAQTIHTIAKTDHWNDLDLRFPTPRCETVMTHANAHVLDPALVYAIIRRESAFSTDARSTAGALGLMQLMPATARHAAQRKLRRQELVNAGLNIALGTQYLRELIDKFNGHQVLAIAAYNAGPNRVLRWLPEEGAMPMDVWIDTLPYAETRRYVRAVLAFAAVYEWQLGRAITRLQVRMGTAPDGMQGTST